MSLYANTKAAENNEQSNRAYKDQIDNSLNLIGKKIVFIAPHHRFRRGFINGLGSIVKTITGNLDYEDAIKFENEISKLQNSVNKINLAQKQSLFIAKHAVEEYSKQIKLLDENQKKLSLMLRNTTFNNNNILVNRLHFLDLYIQIDFSLQLLLDKLVILEDAMTFAQLEVMHPSIVSPHILINEMLAIQKSFNFRPVDSITISNIHSLEKSISVKAYSTDHTLTFILDIPSIDINQYDLIHLYSIPDKQNLAIIPKSKYLVLGTNEYSYLEEDCKQITQNTQLCTSLNTLPVDKSEDCIISLVKHQYTNCTRAKIDLKQGRIQKLQDNKWLIILKEEEVLRTKCGTKSEYKRISGIHIASITSDCQMQILNRTLTTNSNTVAADEIIPLPSKVVIPEENTHFNLQLEDISLDSIHELIERADNLQEPTIDWQTMMATPSWSTLGLYLILTTILLWKLWQWRQRRPIQDKSRTEDAAGSCGTRFHLKEGGVRISPSNVIAD
ncbi:hypothetical protein PYW07_006634 [Mythimna separata]|uniref:Envelope protein n=1 Tax=Mythimna separata TaxID=271217 RepID=A0AAD7YV80_MYTSE|nr:hypothetical protein PYW07_006634 [Mythimna separata]